MNTHFASKLHTTLASIVFVAATLTATSHAQTGRQVVQVTIPFAFQQASAHLNPGVYSMVLDSDNILLIRGSSGSGSAMALVHPDTVGAPATVGKAVFHRYGDQYFLREVWINGSSTHLDVQTSKAEKSLQKELHLAANRPDTNGTQVAILEMPH